MRHVGIARWRQLSAQLDELLELDASAREARLGSLRQSDAALADELSALLAQQQRIDAEGFLSGQAGDVLDELSKDAPTLAGQTFGAYTIESSLGAGGMGSVWLARRSDGRYEGQVAVKLLNLALLGRGGAERFAREGQVLARLTHPNIARLLDAGVSASGQPYLVLEHVQGEPIDRWCDSHSLGIDARLRLMQGVLDAVAHAHSKLVLHRDLKPSNILVASHSQVKLLDFGIAKLLDDEALGSPSTELTQLAGRAFTPDYAAPEQVEGAEVSTATDTYALGVLLYVLLSGVHPTAKATDTPVQRLRSVVDAEPPRLSDAASGNTGSAAARGDSPARLASSLRGDLENICAKALKKSPAERYATVGALADDLRRYLAHEPVSARADSWAYRSAKFVRRHRLAVGAVSVVVLALAAGIVGTAWQAREARLERSQAVVQRDRAQALLGRNEAIVNFVDVMFTESIPAGQGAAIREMLERSEHLIAGVFADQPTQQAEILRVLASYYTALNLPNKNFELLTRAAEIVERVPDRSLKARLACARAASASLLGKVDEATAILDRWVDTADLEAAVAASCLQARAIVAQNATDAQAALRYAQAGLQRLRESPDAAPLLEATLLGDIGFANHLTGRNHEADASYQAALDRLREIGRGQSSEAGRMATDRGIVRYAMSDFQGGLELFDQALQIAQTRGDANVPPGILGNRAFGLEQLGRYREALQAYASTLKAAQRNGLLAGQAYAMVGRASVLAALGDSGSAQRSLDEARPLLQDLPKSHAVQIRRQLVQAKVSAARGDLDAAAKLFSGVIDQMSSAGLSHPALANAYRQRAELALRRGDVAVALADAQTALDLARKLQGSNLRSDLTGLASLTLGRALRASGDGAGARAVLASARTELLATLGADHPETRTTTELLGAN